MENPILSETDLTSINSWILNLEHQKIKDYETKLKVVDLAVDSLKFDYKVIGSGRSRIVLDLNNGFVLKIALSVSGLNCNQREFNMYTFCPDDLRKHLCPVEDFGLGWIIMKKIGTMLPKDKKYNKRVREIEKKFIKYGIKPSDITDKGKPKFKNLALSEEDEIVVIDYGSFKPKKKK